MNLQNTNKKIIVEDWGLISYAEAWQKQEEYLQHIVKIKMENRQREVKEPTPNYLIFCEHPHVYTLGKTGTPHHLLLNAEELSQRDIEYYPINRGGDITYHGPGQIVGYPILDLDNFFTDIHRYLRTLEDVMINTLAQYAIKGDRIMGATGVWIEPSSPGAARKICAMGIRASRWVTMHGWALNVNTDLAYFEHIIPCGIMDKAVTSLAKETGKEMDIEEVKKWLIYFFSKEFDANIIGI